MLRANRIATLSLSFGLRFVRRSLPTRLNRRLLAILLISAITTLSVPPVMARSAVNAAVANSSELIDHTHAFMALFWWPFNGQQEGGVPQDQPVNPPTEQELEARVARLEMNPQGETNLRSGESAVMGAIPFDADDNILHGLTVHWTSDNSQVVSITEEGLARGGAAGMATITATAGQKQEIVRVTVIEDPSMAVAKNQSGGLGSRSSKVRWEPNFKQASGSSPRLLAHGAKLVPAALAPAPEVPIDADPLPDEETGSLYTSENIVGSPAGRTPLSATSAAAVRGKERGNENFSFGLPLLNLAGRAGLDVNLSLVYNSRSWNKSTTSNNDIHMSYDVDNGWPAAGFRLGYGQLEDQSLAFTLTDPDGTRHEMFLVGVSNVTPRIYETRDGSFISYNSETKIATYPNGTRVLFGAAGTTSGGAPGKRSFPIQITDRNGNFIQINYQQVNSVQVGPQINSIRDTLARFIDFNYASGGKELTSITAPRYLNPINTPDRGVVRFIYDTLTINPNFAATLGTQTITVTKPATPIKVIKYAYFPGTKSGYRFDYSRYGMINKITQLRGMVTNTDGVAVEGVPAAITEYVFPADTATGALSDVPKYTQRLDSYSINGSLVSLPPVTFALTEFPNTETATATVTAPDSSVFKTTLTFKPEKFENGVLKPAQWDDGLIKETQISKAGKVLSKTAYTWEQDLTYSSPRLQRIEVTNDNSQTRTIFYSYENGKFSNVTALYECDFGANCSTLANARLNALRRTEITYLEDTSWTDRGLLRLPTSAKVFEGTATSPASKIEYSYDGYATGTALTNRTDIIMHDAAYGTGEYHRGNVTSTNSYANATSATPSKTYNYSYDTAGNLLTEPVSCCQLKTYTYTTTYKYAYPTMVTRGTSPQLDTEATYDYNTGLVSTTKDENNQQTNYTYDWATLRPLEVDRPDGGYTKYGYDDSVSGYVKTMTLLDTSTAGDRVVENYRYLDGLGRVIRTFGPPVTDPTGGITGTVRSTTDIEYDNMGRLFRVSNPYFTSITADPYAPVPATAEWTKRQYDGLGRVTIITQQDNNTVVATYTGDTLTVKDQAGKQRGQVFDALGRLIRLDEPDDTGDIGTTSPTQATYYKYDVLDNLTEIKQGKNGEQVRSFKYDSLSRATHEKQVEAKATLNDLGQVVSVNPKWTGVYKYDSEGRLSDSYDARGIHAVYTYDGLNRITDITYPQDNNSANPDIKYIYDTVTGSFFNKGRLVEVQTLEVGVVKTSQKYNYNKMGQVAQHSQTIGSGTPYTTKYLYNLAGQLTKETYPSLRAFNYSYDDAGRLESITSGSNTYVSGFEYAPHGRLLAESWGDGTTPMTHSMDYNTRLQVDEIKLTINNVERKRFDYFYGEVNPDTGGVNATKNTGQVARIDGYDNGVKQWQQRYSYDFIGRLADARQYNANGTTLNWRADYDYDEFGNRYQSSALNTGISFNQVQTGDIDLATNRFVSNMTYDNAGNVLTNNYRSKQYKYDANGRQYWIANLNNTGVATAVYDGLGQRVETTVNGEKRQMVYDALGQFIAEYKEVTGQMVLERESIYRGGEEIAFIAGGQTQYLLRDHQASARMEVKGDGTINGTYDYLPFGEQLLTNSNTTPTQQRYAGMLHDEATDSEHTWWRKYDSELGRWTSPDPYRGSMSTDDPQSFNSYAYVQNDPVNNVDPSGLAMDFIITKYPDGTDAFYYNVFGPGYESWSGIVGHDGDPGFAGFVGQGTFEIWHLLSFTQSTYRYEGALYHDIQVNSLDLFGVVAPGGFPGRGEGESGGGPGDNPFAGQPAAKAKDPCAGKRNKQQLDENSTREITGAAQKFVNSYKEIGYGYVQLLVGGYTKSSPTLLTAAPYVGTKSNLANFRFAGAVGKSVGTVLGYELRCPKREAGNIWSN